MNRWISMAVAAAFVTVVAPTSADAQLAFGIGAGPSFPSGDFADRVGTGFHGGATADFGLPLLPIGLRGDLMFQHFPGANALPNVQQLFGTVNGTFGLLPLPMASLYLTGGVGLYADSGSGSEEWSTDFGLNGGLGARLNLLVIRPFLEARYHTTLGDQRNAFIPVTIGLRF